MGILRIAAIGTKAFVVGGAVYYSHDYGIWGNMKETEEGYSRLKSDLQNNWYSQQILQLKSEYIVDTEVTKEIYGYQQKISSQLPPLPSTEKLGSLWNKGVENTFEALADSPSLLNGLTVQAYSFVSKQLKDALDTEPQPIPEIKADEDNAKEQ